MCFDDPANDKDPTASEEFNRNKPADHKSMHMVKNSTQLLKVNEANENNDEKKTQSVPTNNHFLLSPILHDSKNKDKIKEMMERKDDEFGNDIEVPENDEEQIQDDWHQSFLANHDRLSFAQNGDNNEISKTARPKTD